MTSESKNPKFEIVVDALIDDSEASLDSVRDEMRSLGYDPDALLARVRATVNAMSKESRLSWMTQADSFQTKFDAAMAAVHSWACRSKEEIDKAFNDARIGRFGAGAQTRLATAFSNVSEITTETKAAFLDEIRLLDEMDKSADDTSQP